MRSNPIGNLMCLAIIGTTAIAAYSEWFPENPAAKWLAPALIVLSIVVSIVIVRFIVAFVPILTRSWAWQNPGVIMGFVFSLSALIYIGVRSRGRMFANVTTKEN